MEERGQWESRTSFILAAMGYSCRPWQHLAVSLQGTTGTDIVERFGPL